MIRAEFLKMRKTILPILHIVVPLVGVILFLLYDSFSVWEPTAKVEMYLTSVAITFPVIVSLICSLAIEQEVTAKLQTFFTMSFHKSTALLSKWTALSVFGLCSTIIAVGGFGIGYEYILRQNPFPPAVYIEAVFIIWGGQLLLYLFHIFLSLQFSKGVSIGIGIVEAVVSALFLTGLGEGVWQFVPCAWSARWSGHILLYAVTGYRSGEIYRDIVTYIVISIIMIAIVFGWFWRFEGRQYNE